MTRSADKVTLYQHRLFGGIVDCDAILAPRLLAIYSKQWSLLKACGIFVDKGFMTFDEPCCTGTFEVSPDASTALRLTIADLRFNTDDVLYVLRRAYLDNRDPARLCRNPQIFVDDRGYGFLKDLK